LIIVPSRFGRVYIFGNNFNNSKLYCGRNEEQTEVRKYLLSFGAEFLSSRLLTKNLKIKIYI